MTAPRAFNAAFRALCLLLLVFVFLRAWLVPFAHDEVATFYFYIQPGSFIPFKAHPDANGHFLTSALGWFCFKLFGSSPLSMRLPSVAAFGLLCYAVYRFCALFSSRQVKFFFIASFLLVFTFLAYYSLCRGYGISMACLLMGAFYFFSFMRGKQIRHFYKFLLFIHLGLAANLTLLFVAVICSFFCVVVQLRSRLFFRGPVLLAWTLHACLIAYWTLFAFFLKDNGALYYGQGESYWAVTFRSLISNLFVGNTAIELVFVVLFIGLTLGLVVSLSRRPAEITGSFSIAFLLFFFLVLTFFLLKHTLGVNYPEDRTGLFFYVFFICAFSFFLDRLSFPRWVIIAPLLAVFIPAAGRNIDLSNHPWTIYETIPPRFFDTLVAEQAKQPRPITIAGHRIREFIYGFENYRSPVKLNHMTSPEALQMNCDYALAVKADKPWYDRYYAELASEDRWGFRLLKRRKPIGRVAVLASPAVLTFEGSQEYYNCFELKDTVFKEGLPLQADVTFEVSRAPVPLQSWLVLQVDAGNADDNFFVRVPLDLVYKDWTKAGKVTLSLVTPNMPKAVRRMVLYFWNINKETVKIRVDSYQLYRLEAQGISEISQAKL